MPSPTTSPASLPGTPAAGDAAELAIVVRNDFIESRHVGHAALVGPDGAVEVALGRPHDQALPRSAVKPWQALASLRAGAVLSGPALAIAAGSHSGESRHRELVTAMLASADIEPGALQCPPAWPMGEAARDQLVRAGTGQTRLAMNCSGKHAGMLRASAAAGWDLSTYRDPDHPLQVAVRATLEEHTGETVDHVAVDGCGAPAFTTSMVGLARAATRLATGDETAAIFAAMRDHPWAVAGEDRPDTVVMQLLDGVVAKGGAEGVMMLATDDGVGVAVKVLDGNPRAAMLSALTLLATTGRDVAAAVEASVPKVYGHGEAVGAVRPGSDLVGTTAAAP